MRLIIGVIAQVVGVLFMVAAFLQWATYDYPDFNPFAGVSIFTPGVLGQVLNWLIVVVLATIGWTLFSYGRKSGESGKGGNREV